MGDPRAITTGGGGGGGRGGRGGPDGADFTDFGGRGGRGGRGMDFAGGIDPRTGQPIDPRTMQGGGAADDGTGGGRGGRGGGGRTRMFSISADDRTNTVLVTGPADKLAQAQRILKEIDVGQPGQKTT